MTPRHDLDLDLVLFSTLVTLLQHCALVLSGIDDTAACGRKPQAVARTGITHLTLVIWVGIELGLVGITVALVGNVGIKLCPSWFAPEQLCAPVGKKEGMKHEMRS